MALLEIDKKHMVKQFFIISMATGNVIAFILWSLISGHIFLVIGFTIVLMLLTKNVNKKGKDIVDLMNKKRA